MFLFGKSFLYALGQIFILHKIYDKRVNWHSLRVWETLFFGMVFMIICSFPFFSYARSLLTIFCLIFMTMHLFSVSMLNALELVFFDFFSSIMMEIIMIALCFSFFGMDGLQNDIILFFLEIIILLGTYFLWNISALKNIKESMNSSPPTFSFLFLLLALSGYSILTVCSFVGKVSFFSILILSFFSLFFLGIGFYGFFLERIEYRDVLKKYELLLETIENYEKLLEDERIIHHEYKNQLMILHSLVQEKEAISYIDAILKEENDNIDTDYANNLSKLPFEGMSGLFYYKYFAAQKMEVCLNLEVGKNIQILKEKKIPVTNISALLKVIGVFLDNALEGAKDSIYKEVDVTFYKNEEKMSITIANSFSSNIDLSDGLVGRTTKGKNHGYGLLLVRKLLKEYQFMKNKTEIISNVFIQTIEIDLKKMKVER